MVIKVQINVLFETHNQDALRTGLYFLLKKADLLYSITFIPCYQADYVSNHNMTTENSACLLIASVCMCTTNKKIKCLFQCSISNLIQYN